MDRYGGGGGGAGTYPAANRAICLGNTCFPNSLMLLPVLWCGRACRRIK